MTLPSADTDARDGVDEGPPLSGRLDDDAATLAAHTSRAAAQLDALSPKPARTPAQQAAAERAHRRTRRLRSHFLAVHAEGVLDRIAGGCPPHEWLAKLSLLAAEAFPGLTPTARQMAAESGLRQADKEGWEIDQGILFHALLAVPCTGDAVVEAALSPTPRAERLLASFQRSGAVRMDTVQLERHGEAAHVTMCHTDCLNAEDNALVADLETAVDLVLLDDTVRVGVVRGASMTHPRYQGRRVFSTGINLTQLHDGHISFVDFLLRRELGFINKMVRGVGTRRASETVVEKPWVAGVDGFAIGGGCQLLPVFDYVVSGADAYFSLPASAEGLVPGTAGLRLRAAGGRFTRQLILDGRKVWAREPDARLLCDEVVDPGEVGAAVDRAVRRLAAPSVVPNRRLIRLAEEPPDRFRTYMAEFALAQSQRLYSPDVLRGLSRRTARLGRRAGRDETG